jgi:hemin uptake protein HemP
MITSPTIQVATAQEKSDSCSRIAHIVNDTVDSNELLGADGKVFIEHNSMKYELRLTRQGKLILTK